MNYGKTHPVYVRADATQPHNYQPGRHTNADSHESYRRAAAKQGKTVGDILAECLMERRRRELVRDE